MSYICHALKDFVIHMLNLAFCRHRSREICRTGQTTCPFLVWLEMHLSDTTHILLPIVWATHDTMMMLYSMIVDFWSLVQELGTSHRLEDASDYRPSPQLRTLQSTRLINPASGTWRSPSWLFLSCEGLPCVYNLYHAFLSPLLVSTLVVGILWRDLRRANEAYIWKICKRVALVVQKCCPCGYLACPWSLFPRIMDINGS